MARLAGDSGYYTFAALDGAGNPKGREFKLPSVTTILDVLPKYLSWWGYELGLAQALQMFNAGHDLGKLSREQLYEEAKRLGREEDGITPFTVLDQAADRGTEVHEIAETFFKTGRLPEIIPDGFRGHTDALVGWWDLYSSSGAAVEVVAVETCLYSLDHRFAGTVDLILKWTTEGDEWYEVIDFKTSKSVYESHLLQAAAYRHAAQEMGVIPDGKYASGKVVVFKPNGKFQEQETDNSIADFLDVKKVWELLCRMNPEQMLRKDYRKEVKKPSLGAKT